MRSLVLVVALAALMLAASAAPIPANEDAAAAPTKPTWTVWSSAKHFFKIQSKINEKKATGSKPSSMSGISAPPMPTSFGVEFKHVREVRRE